MKVSIHRAALLRPLQMIGGVVERRQTLPILANILVTVNEESLSLTATDLEVELIGNVNLTEPSTPGVITVSARKLLDFCRTLPDDAVIKLESEGDQAVLRSGRSRFLLTTLPAEDFPTVEGGPFSIEFEMSQAKLKKVISKVYFAMGQQDVRHYLNGALFDINHGVMRCIATDGHRLAFSSADSIEVSSDAAAKVILPRKSVLELIRLLDSNSEDKMMVCIGENHFRVKSNDFTFTSKLINAQYPDYDKLIPRHIENTATASRDALKQALTRASILSNEKFRGIRLQLEQDTLRIVANNPEQEEAEEMVQMEYQGNSIEIGFNVAYLLDVVSAISSEMISWSFSNDPNGGVLIKASEKDDSLYVVMPMRL